MAEIDALTDKVKDLGGVWKMGEHVDNELGKVKKGERGGKRKKMKAVKVQLSYRRKVYRQQLSDTKLWNYSENGHIFTLEELTSRLKSIIREHVPAKSGIGES